MASSLFRSSSDNNPPTTSISDMTSLQRTINNVQNPWNDIRDLLSSKQRTMDEKQFRDNLSMGYGKGSPLHELRLYDEGNKEEDVRVTLYRDSASWCPYCQKVWTSLEEKKIPYKIERINMRCYGDKPRSFTLLQPSGNIPVAIIDDDVFDQSNDIMFALEERFPDHKPLLPSSDDGRDEVRMLLRLERRLFSAWLYWLTGNNNPKRFRDEFVKVLNEVESTLNNRSNGGDFFLGKDVSLVDMMFVPFLERMASSLLYYKGFQIRFPRGVTSKFPAVNRWFDAMETLDSYQLTKSDHYTHCWDLPPQLGGCTYEDGGLVYEKAINGERRLGNDDVGLGSWELPLQPHNGGIEPDWEWVGDEHAAKRQAVDRICYNIDNLVKFACRGAGQKGIPSYMASLADPRAVSNESIGPGVEVCLNVICRAMLDEGGNVVEDDDENEVVKDLNVLVRSFVGDGGSDFVNDVVSSLVYLRDRIGVPRDMTLPAARQLRAYLNWVIGKLLLVQDN